MTTMDSIAYILLLIFEIPSILCALFILIFFFSNWRLLMIKVLNNHAIFILMIISTSYIILDLPFTINHYRLGYDQYRSRTFCQWWYWLDYTLVTTSLFLVAVTSIQRHLLVFHHSCLQGHVKRWIFHYIPLIICLIYPGIFYLVVICFHRCNSSIYVESYSCSLPCYSEDFQLFSIDWFLNVVSPIITIILVNFVLLCRIIYSFKKLHYPQTRIWKKRRKLILQFIPFSILYILGWLPTAILSLLERYFLPNLYTNSPNLTYINYLNHFVYLLQPMICLFALPELFKFLKKKIHRRQMMIHAVT